MAPPAQPFARPRVPAGLIWDAPLRCTALAWAWVALAGLEGLAAAGPLLVLSLVLGLALALFARYATGTYALLPAALRLQLALEFSDFWAQRMAGDPGAAQATKQHLAIALAAARGTAWAGRVRTLSAMLESGPSPSALTRWSEIARGCVGELLAVRGLRAPHHARSKLPTHAAAPLGWAIGLFGCLGSAALLGRGPLGLADALLALTAGLACSRLLILFAWISHKRSELLAKSSYRIMVITDQPFHDALVASAIGHYARCGHVFAASTQPMVHGAEPAFDGYAPDTFTVTRESLSQFLAAFAMGADLAIVRAHDESLAAEGGAFTGFQASGQKWLAEKKWLAELPAAPPGYEWLAPAALKGVGNEASGSARSRTLAFAAPTARFWVGWRFYLRLFTFAALLCVGRSAPLLLLLAASAVGAWLPGLLGNRRRMHADYATLRAPKAPAVSRDLKPARMELCVAMFAIAATWAAAAWVVAGTSLGWGPWGLALLAGLALLTSAQVYSGIVGGTLYAVKWRLDWNFRVVVFRRNSVRFGYAHKAMVLATCGRYGQVIAIDDPTLRQTEENYGEWRESSQGAWLQVFSEMNALRHPVAILHDWRWQVLAELDAADVVVFDWAEEVTANMRWELREARRRLPGHRLLLVFNPACEQRVADLATKLDAQGGPPIRRVPLARERDDQFLWPGNRPFEQGFKTAFHELVGSLQPEPRAEVAADVRHLEIETELHPGQQEPSKPPSQSG